MQPAGYQAIFNKVYFALLKQGVASTAMIMQPFGKEAQRCRYRGDNENKCAVGHLIPDELYTPDLEGRESSDIRVVQALMQAMPYFDGGHLEHNFICALQRAHDFGLNNGGLGEWKVRMGKIAVQFNLQVPTTVS